MKNLEKCLDVLLENGTARNIVVCVGKGDKILAEVYKSSESTLLETTKFDMASVTKILATTPLSLIAIDTGKLKLDNKVSDFFDCDSEQSGITVKNLLTHTIGIGHESLCEKGNTYENIAEYILKIPLKIPVGSDVLYSCPAFILLGKILEKIYGKRLDVLFKEMVAKPLGMDDSSFLPEKGDIINSSLSENERGIVNDYNCRFLGGVAGNAGVFSNMRDMKKFVNFFLKKGAPLISEKTFMLATQNHTPDMSESRGLGFLYVDEKYSQTGALFEDGSVGHCGHTGQSVFVDYKDGLFVIILSDMTISTVKKYGNENYGEVIAAREKIHRAIKEDLK